MTEQNAADARTEALQAVIDRVVSYEESADDQTIRKELTEALGEAGVDLDAATVDRLVQRIAERPEGIEARDFA